MTGSPPRREEPGLAESRYHFQGQLSDPVLDLAVCVGSGNEREADEFSASYNYHGPGGDTGDNAELPPIDDSGRWQIRLSLWAKKALLEESEEAAADKLKAKFAEHGYSGSVRRGGRTAPTASAGKGRDRRLMAVTECMPSLR